MDREYGIGYSKGDMRYIVKVPRCASGPNFQEVVNDGWVTEISSATRWGNSEKRTKHNRFLSLERKDYHSVRRVT